MQPIEKRSDRHQGEARCHNIGNRSARGDHAHGKAAQERNRRWEDYTQTAIDPTDDLTIWYVGDYLKKGEKNYSTRIGAFRIRR